MHPKTKVSSKMQVQKKILTGQAASGCRLREIRLEKNINQKWVCEVAGVSETNYKIMERGANVKLDAMIRVADALGVAACEIWTALAVRKTK